MESPAICQFGHPYCHFNLPLIYDDWTEALPRTVSRNKHGKWTVTSHMALLTRCHSYRSNFLDMYGNMFTFKNTDLLHLIFLKLLNSTERIQAY